MRFWDSSAIVPLLWNEPGTATAFQLLKEDRRMIVWSLSALECLSALYRSEKNSRVSIDAARAFQDRLKALRSAWTEVQDLMLVRKRAERIIAIHALKAADS